MTKAVESVAWLSLLRREMNGDSDTARAGTVETSSTTLHRLSPAKPARLCRLGVLRKLDEGQSTFTHINDELPRNELLIR